MKKTLNLLFAIVCSIAISAGVQAETIDTRIGKLEFTHDFANGYPTDATVQKLFNEMDFQRAVQAYISHLIQGTSDCLFPRFKWGQFNWGQSKNSLTVLQKMQMV